MEYFQATLFKIDWMVGRSCSTLSMAARASIIYFRQIVVAYKSLNAVWKRCFLYATTRRLRLREGLSPVTCPRSGRWGHVQRGDWKMEVAGAEVRRRRTRWKEDCDVSPVTCHLSKEWRAGSCAVRRLELERKSRNALSIEFDECTRQ